MENSTNISHVRKREIQAPVVSSIIHGFMNEFGKEKTLEVLAKIIKKDAIESGNLLSQKFNGGKMNDLSNMITEVWCEDGAMEMTVIRENENEFHFDVTKCLYAEVYKNLGIEELGKCLSCERDFSFNDGFNPEIILERTKTIMEGDDICDFKYSKKNT